MLQQYHEIIVFKQYIICNKNIISPHQFYFQQNKEKTKNIFKKAEKKQIINLLFQKVTQLLLIIVD